MTPQLTQLNDVNLAAVGDLTGAIEEDPTRAATVWKAEVQWKGGFASEAKIRDFAPIASDEPTALGGTDTAPNPVEQLLAALGNCLSVGYAANASAVNVELRGLSIQLEGDLDLTTFLGLGEGHAGYDSIRVKVHIDSNAAPEVIEEIHRRVVATSPVGHTLLRPIPVDVALA